MRINDKQFNAQNLTMPRRFEEYKIKAYTLLPR